MNGIRWLILGVMIGVGGCVEAVPPEQYLARVRDQYLTEEDIAAALGSVPTTQDPAMAREQIIEQWVTNELLFQEARRLNLREAPEVQHLLEENERSVLISAFLSRLYDEAIADPTAAEIRAYFEQHQDQLRLREPFVRVRHLAAAEDSAGQARTALQRAMRRAEADSLWPQIADTFADDSLGARSLSDTYVPEARLFMQFAPLREALTRLNAGEIAPVTAAGGRFHVLQLIDRVPVGTIPDPAWIEDEVKQRLVIQARKQMYARQVQRLRTEALAREALELP